MQVCFDGATLEKSRPLTDGMTDLNPEIAPNTLHVHHIIPNMCGIYSFKNFKRHSNVHRKWNQHQRNPQTNRITSEFLAVQQTLNSV